MDSNRFQRSTSPRPIAPQVTENNVMNASYQENLARYIGRFIICRLLIGTQQMETSSGILREVGPSFFTLADPCSSTITTGDLYSLKYFSAFGEAFDSEAYCRSRANLGTIFPLLF